MLSEYLAVVRVLRRPMRNWWMRVGSWWLIVFAACHIYNILYAWRIHHLVINQMGALSTELLAYALLNHLSVLLRSVVVWALFLTAALTALRFLDELVKGSSAPMVSDLPVLRFLLGLVQCGWILLISSGMLTIHSIVSHASFQAQFPDMEMPVQGVLDYATQFTDSVALSAQGFGWAAALLAVVFWRPLLAWIWVVVMMILPTLWTQLSSFLIIASVQLPEMNQLSKSWGGFPAVWLITLLMVVAMLGSYRARNQVLANGLFAAFLLSSLIGTTWRLLPLKYLNGMYCVLIVDSIDWASNLWFMPAKFMPSWYRQDESVFGMLQIYLPPVNLTFDLPDAFQLASAALNILWVLLIWLVVIFLALRKRSGDRHPHSS